MDDDQENGRRRSERAGSGAGEIEIERGRGRLGARRPPGIR